MALKAEVSLRFDFQQGGPGDFAASFQSTIKKILSFADGTASGQANLLYVAERDFLSATADTIDLAGVLEDAFGGTITMAEIVGIIIIGESKAGVKTTVTLSVGAGASPWFGMFGATGDVIKVPPGGMFALFAPDAAGLGTVTAGTGDILTVTPGAAAGSYQIAILARSA